VCCVDAVKTSSCEPGSPFHMEEPCQTVVWLFASSPVPTSPRFIFYLLRLRDSEHMWVCAHTDAHAQMHRCTCTDAPTHIYTCRYTHRHTCTETHRYTHANTHRHTHMHRHPTHIYTYRYTDTHAQIHTDTHTPLYTHLQPAKPPILLWASFTPVLGTVAWVTPHHCSSAPFCSAWLVEAYSHSWTQSLPLKVNFPKL
jgi:hypothetical protein